MRHTWLSTLLAVPFALAALPAWALPNPTGDAALMKRLRGGEVVSRLTGTGPVRQVQVMGFIPHPASMAFRVFTDYPRRPSIYPTTRKAEIRRASATKPRVYYLMAFPWPIGDRWVQDEETLDSDGTHMTWRMLEGNVKSYSGEAQFYPDGNGRCVLVFQAKADPNIAVIPEWLMGQIQRLLLPSVIRSLRRYMDAGLHLRPAT